MHLGSLMHGSWSTALEVKNPDNKSLEQIAELIREEGNQGTPQHQRRMELLKAKRRSEKHSDFLDKLGNLLSVAEFDSMTGDEMVIPIFTESTDPHMARLVMDMPEKENPTMQSLKVKVKETENSRKQSGQYVTQDLP